MGSKPLTIALSVVFSVIAARSAVAQSFQIAWQTIGGGGGVSAGGNFTLAGTIGQPDASAAGALAGGSYSLSGGFWSVTLPPCTIFAAADFNQDCFVDQADLNAFLTCGSGAGVPLTTGCEEMDLDPDGDVDMNDFGILQRCYSGAGNPADPTCACPPDQTSCGGTCTSLQSDTANCGACGQACDAALTCENGSCVACPGGGTLCSGVCTNIAFDTQNCGGCGIVCAGGQTCSGGICQDPW